MSIELVTRDIFLRHTATDGKPYVREHRVWDVERFIAAQQAAAQKLNDGEEAGKPRLAKVEQITEEQYRAERKTQ